MKAPPTKLCEHPECDRSFTKPSNTPWGRWAKRRFCSHRCWWMARPNWNRYADREVAS